MSSINSTSIISNNYMFPQKMHKNNISPFTNRPEEQNLTLILKAELNKLGIFPKNPNTAWEYYFSHQHNLPSVTAALKKNGFIDPLEDPKGEIRGLAMQLTEGITNTLERAKKIASYTMNEIGYKQFVNDEKCQTALDVFHSKKGDCDERSFLFMELAENSRIFSGLMQYAGYEPGHVFPFIYMNGHAYPYGPGAPERGEELKHSKIVSTRDIFALYLVDNGATLQTKGKLKKAMIEYEKAIEIDPYFSAAHLNIGSLYVELGDAASGEMEYKQAIKCDPDELRAYLNLGGLYMNHKQYGDAESISLLGIDRFKNKVELYNVLQMAYVMMNRTDDALKAIYTGLKIDPDHAGLLTNLGYIYGIRGDLVHAEIFLKKAIKSDPNKVNAHADLGNIYLLQDKLDNAEKEYKRAVELDPNDAVNYFNLGQVHIRQKLYKSAEVEFLTALRIDPNRIDACYGLGYVYEEQNKLNEAEQMLARAFQNRSFLKIAGRELVKIYKKQKQLWKALQTYQQILAVFPNDAEVHYELGVLYKEHSMLKQANIEFDLAKKLKGK